jgi:hypothetical protein
MAVILTSEVIVRRILHVMGWCMIGKPLTLGVLLRRWRRSRCTTQEGLAPAANSSTRHLSCLETGRAQRISDMILRLSGHLQIPLRDHNVLLAAGFAPAFQDRRLPNWKR